MDDDSADLRSLRETIRDVLDAAASREQVHRFVDSGSLFDADLWQKAASLGWFQLAVPEAFGGLGLGFAELAVLYEELGRCVAPLPFLGTQLAIDAIARFGSKAQQETWLPQLGDGALPASFANLGPVPDTALHLTGDSGALRLEGQVRHLLDGAAAKLWVLLARDDGGKDCFVLVEPGRDGVTVEAVATSDQTRHLASAVLSIRLSEDHVLAVPGDEGLGALASHGALALAVDSWGGANAIFEKTIEYLKIREQFGRPIGSFQALKHRCANHKVALEASGALLAEAVRSLSQGIPEARLEACLAKFYLCDVSAEVVRDMVQLHGGIGFTWEHDCHLYLKRAKLNQALFGSSAEQMDEAAKRLVAA